MNSAASPFHLLAKPTGAKCNLDCKYCFFLSKEMLYPGDRLRMSDQLLETYIRQLLEAQPSGEVNVAWQGGEPTLMGLDFFKRSIEYVEKYRKPDQRILHTMQTNGILLDDEWCAFFKEHNFLVGLSIDGPREMHDAYRVNKGGEGSFDQVMRAWETLHRHGVEVNILCTIHAANADHPLEVYRFFRDQLRAAYMQFIPIVERTTQELLPLANLGWGERPGADRPLYTQRGTLVTERSVGAEQFGRFLIAMFDEWVRRDVGKVFVQTFDVALGSWLGQHNLCIFSPTCGSALALEHNGDLYSCDHYVEPDYLLGNIQQTPDGGVGRLGEAARLRAGQADQPAQVLSRVRGTVRLPRRVSAQPFHHDSGWRARTQLPMRRLQAVLQPYRPRDEDYGRPAAPGPICRRNHGVLSKQDLMNGASATSGSPHPAYHF